MLVIKEGDPTWTLASAKSRRCCARARAACSEKECPSTVVRRLMEDERGYDAELWRKMAGLGWTGLVIPEAYGGAGSPTLTWCWCSRRWASVLLPSPFIWTAMVAEAIKRAGSEAQKQALLPKIAAGDLIATVAWMEPSGLWGAEGIAMTARKRGNGFMLDGVKLFVNDAPYRGLSAGRGAHAAARA